MSNYKLVDDKDVPDNVVIPDDTWAFDIDGVIVSVNSMTFAEEENDDGLIEVDVDYDILNFDDIDDVPDDFNQVVGECAVHAWEEGMNIKTKIAMMEEAKKEAEEAKKNGR